MTNEDEELLLKDLCARLPYGVKLLYNSNSITQIKDRVEILRGVNIGYTIWYETNYIHSEYDSTSGSYNHFKPYLRPISSMTAEEVKKLVKIHLSKYSPNSNYNNLLYIDGISKHGNNAWSAWIHFRTEDGDVKQTCVIVGWVNWETTLEEINWLYKNHFDVPHWIKSKNTYKTMIELDLALPAPEGMYDVK